MTALSLEQWRRIIGYNPWHFWGLSGTKAPVQSQCNTVVTKYSWQNADAAGRDAILEAIQTAERRLFTYLRYELAPVWKEDTLQWPNYPKVDIKRLGYSEADSKWIGMQLKDGYIQALGVEANSLIGNVVLAFSDLDGDGLKETFTASIAAPAGLTDPDKVSVYFAAADRFDGSGPSENWQIRPLGISIAAGTISIRGFSWQIVKPLLYEGVTPNGGNSIDPDILSNFAASLDVYWHYTDVNGITNDTSHALLIWETPPYPQFACCPTTNSTDPSAEATAMARGTIRDGRMGEVGLGQAAYDPATAQWFAVNFLSAFSFSRPPDRLKIRYFAGKPLVDGMVDRIFATVIARFSAAELTKMICACDTANRDLYNWQFDLARSSGNAAEAYGMITQADLGNPFGTRRGQMFAWKQIRDMRLFNSGFAV